MVCRGVFFNIGILNIGYIIICCYRRVQQNWKYSIMGFKPFCIRCIGDNAKCSVSYSGYSDVIAYAVICIDHVRNADVELHFIVSINQINTSVGIYNRGKSTNVHVHGDGLQIAAFGNNNIFLYFVVIYSIFQRNTLCLIKNIRITDLG